MRNLSWFRYAAKSLQSCPTLCDPVDGSPPGSPCPWDSPGKNTGVGCPFLLLYRYNFKNHFWKVHMHAGDPGSIPGSGRSPQEGSGNPLQYSCLENPTDRGAGQATVYWIAELDTTMRLTFTFTWLLYLLFSKLPIIDYLVERITRLKNLSSL